MTRQEMPAPFVMTLASIIAKRLRARVGAAVRRVLDAAIRRRA